VDPLAEKVSACSPYNQSLNNPINLVDFDGKAPSSPPYGDRQKRSELSFAIAHPIAAYRIGSYDPGSNNISTYAGNFAINATKNTSLTIGKEMGKDIASQAGFAHEGFRVPDAIVSAEGYTTKKHSEADAIADLFNNEIGRKIGADNPDASNVELAKNVIEEFKENGMWTVQKTDEGYIATKTKLTQKQFEEALKNIQPLHENGLKQKIED
jgi:hypothetical protein